MGSHDKHRGANLNVIPPVSGVKQVDLTAEFSHPFSGGDDVSQPDAKTVIHNDNIPLCYERSIDQDIHGFSRHGIKLHDRSMREL